MKGRFDNGLTNISVFTSYIIFPLTAFILHLIIPLLGKYELFRDELYYLACSNHLALGYVDHPPFSIWLLKIWVTVFGNSFLSVRFLPALLSGVIVYIAVYTVNEFGGNARAKLIAALLTLLTPFYLAFSTIWSMNVIDILIWQLLYLILIKYFKTGNKTLLLLLGITMGIGLLNKISVGWFIGGVIIGVFFSKHKILIINKYFWSSFVIAVMIFIPFIYWNVTNGFAHPEFIKNASLTKYSAISRLDTIISFIVGMNPFLIFFWGGGLYYLLTHRNMQVYKIFGIVFLTTIGILLLKGNSKGEYLIPASTILIPAGALFSVKLIFGLRRFQVTVYRIVLLYILSTSLPLIPFALPILSPEEHINYSAKLGMAPNSNEGKRLGKLPQYQADMFGWENMAIQVSGFYKTLPISEQDSILFFGNNYGEAGAIEYYYNKYKLPKAISFHNNYYLWCGDAKVNNIIVFRENDKDLVNIFREVIKVGEIKHSYSIPYENNLNIYYCKGLIESFAEIREKGKNYN